MRNLHLIKQQCHKFDLHSVVGITEDGSRYGDSFFGVTKEGVLFQLCPSMEELVERVDLMRVEDEEGEERAFLSQGCRVVGIQFIAELESVCVVSDLGDIVLYHVRRGECDVVGMIEEGIEAMSWSPDQEIVVFATGMQTIVIMTKDWAVLCDSPIDSAPIKAQPKPVQMQHQQTASTEEEDDVSATRNTPHVSWRGDGEMFAVNSRDDVDGKQWIRVWERSGDVFSKTEPINGLGENVNWVPDGHVIASHQYLASKKQTNIVFFERNGLQHYDFLLCSGRAHVHLLQYNQESEVLVILFTPPGEDQVPILQLWYRSNYHWYLKKELIFERESAPEYFVWDPISSLRLHICCRDGTYWCNDFTWEEDISPGMDRNNACVAAVIDGPEVKLTPFRYVTTPPPMCNSVIKTRNKGNVSHVSLSTFDTQHGSSRILLQTSNGEVEIYEVNPNSKPPRFGLIPKFIGTLTVNARKLRHMSLISHDMILAMEYSESAHSEYMLLINISDFADDDGKLACQEIQRSRTSSKILAVCTNDLTRKIFLESDSGEMYEQAIDSLIDEGEPTEEVEKSFDTPCQHIASCIMDGEEVVIGLSDKGVLYVQSIVACTNCSSFALHDKFLLYTTYGNKLRIIPLHLSVFDALELAEASQSFKNDDSFREIERGARLVSVVNTDIRVVLQMPRGNLESITPRALVLSYIKNLLNNYDYGQAVHITRKHKIDMNLLYDHNPQEFLSHMEDFVNRVDSAEYINLFVSALSNEDTTKTKYPGYFADLTDTLDMDEPYQQNEGQALVAGKINSICDALRDVLIKSNVNGKLTSSILTIYAKHQPPQIEEALKSIHEIYTREKQDLDTDKDHFEYDSALQHLIFLADVDNLFDVALGMYDFELVMMVAKKSQKDPKEYLPFLTKLQKMEPIYMKYTIDMHLGRYDRALRNLSSSDNEEHYAECLQLVKEQHLYKLALELFADEPEKQAQVFEAYGDYLLNVKSDQEQAAFTYMQCKQYSKAQQAFKKAGDYRMTFALTKRLNQRKDDMRNLARDLTNVLEINGKALDAAIVYRDYLEDIEEAILLLIKYQLWQDAIHFASLGGRHDLIETHVRPSIDDAYNERIGEMRDNATKFEKYVTRLTELREEKRKQQELLQQQQHLVEGEFGEDEQLRMQNMDTLSDTSSVQSGMSGYSGVSVYTTTSTLSGVSATTSSWGERRRAHKNKKKRVKMKKGSVFEEDNIVNRLQALLPSSNTQLDIGRLIQALVFFGRFEEARNLQNALESAIHLALKHISLIEQPFTLPPVAGQPETITRNPKKIVDVLGKEDERWQWKLTVLQ